ncbi:MAG TPA: SET domain-containing protein-lysine N-methyltransferase [Steroidobacteraceae bacterium]|nr:SET domain-containing protein-lysine N-methyltransferase [Steroidobacteraceae bacterium]
MASKVRVLIEVRSSDVHGRGVFARRRIPKGMRIIEYTGDRITHAEADRRYEDHEESDNHTFLFSVDRGLVIDAGVGGNDARFINHSCDPNCESVIERRHVFIDAVRDIAAGEELAYDYQIGRERNDPPNVDEIYACRCGAARCRGTMLWPPRRSAPRKRKSKSKRANVRVTAKGRGGTPPGRSRARQKGTTGGARKRAARHGRSR